MLAIIRQFHGWVMANARTCSTWSRGSPAKVCGRAILLFNMFFAAVLRVAEKRFTADAAIIDSMVQPQRKKKEKGEKKRGGRYGLPKPTGEGGGEARTLWGTLCTLTMRAPYRDHHRRVGEDDDGGIVTACVCEAFGLTVLEVKTEIMLVPADESWERGGRH